MKQQAINHEVLLFIGSGFSKKLLCERDSKQQDNSVTGQLERACWHGLIFEILPDIIESPSPKNQSYTWEVTTSENFIDVKIGAAPYSVEYRMSVNPYLFLPEKNFN